MGKSITARLVAQLRDRAAVVDVDDVRQMVVAGHAAPWQGEEGLQQQALGVENACLLARRFLAHRIEVVLADVLTPTTLLTYRQALPGCVIVRLHVTSSEARRRAGMRPVHLTAAAFEQLHRQDRDNPPAADHHVEATAMTTDDQADAVSTLWCRWPVG